MYHLALCEDSSEDRKRTHQYLKEYFSENPGQYVLEDFSSGEQFLSQVKPYQFQMVIFDVEMSGINGVETANRLRKQDRSVVIAFATAHPGYVFSSFQAEPIQYLLKPVKKDSFWEFMDRALERIQEKNTRSYTLSFNNVIYNIPVSDILYFESEKRTVCAVTMGERYPFYAKLNDVEKEDCLKNFIRCHQSFLVNPEYVSRISNDSILLLNGNRIIISRGKANVVKNSYMFYVGNLKL